MNWWTARLAGLVFALGLGYALYGGARGGWENYWLLKDSRQGMAVVTQEGSHDHVNYKYTVDGREYAGDSGRNYRDKKYSEVRTGEKSPVYYSSSHPWISTLRMPEAIVEGAPFWILVLVFEFFALATVINPKGKWAFNFSGTK